MCTGWQMTRGRLGSGLGQWGEEVQVPVSKRHVPRTWQTAVDRWTLPCDWGWSKVVHQVVSSLSGFVLSARSIDGQWDHASPNITAPQHRGPRLALSDIGANPVCDAGSSEGQKMHLHQHRDGRVRVIHIASNTQHSVNEKQSFYFFLPSHHSWSWK